MSVEDLIAEGQEHAALETAALAEFCKLAEQPLTETQHRHIELRLRCTYLSGYAAGGVAMAEALLPVRILKNSEAILPDEPSRPAAGNNRRLTNSGSAGIRRRR